MSTGALKAIVENMTSIDLLPSLTPRGQRTLKWETGIDISAVTTRSATADFQPLLIRGVVGRSLLTKLNIRITLRSGEKANAALECIDEWVRRRPDLATNSARPFFAMRGVIADV